MPSKLVLVSFLSVTLTAFAACGDDDDAVDPGTPDAGTPDAGGCDPTLELPLQWRPIAAVSAGAITTSTTDGVTSATIDATAGGPTAAADNPYIYLDLVGAAKVDVNDVASYGAATWDLALKRASIRVNGGDSGPGGVKIAPVAATTLAEVTEAPAESAFVTDDWADADCVTLTTPGGEPLTAFGEWYDYDDAAHTLTPKVQVYVIEAHDGSLLKLRLTTYYGDAASPMRGAVYQAEWAAL